MVHSAKKMVLIGVMACVTTLCAVVTEGQSAEKAVGPEGLNYAGIYALRQGQPSLTGSGVKFAVVCRSITYVDGEPQNDYRPSTEHNCFKDKQFSFHDGGQIPAGISPHSTAICSILLGSDANAFDSRPVQFQYQGVAPAAEAEVYEFWHFLINNVFGQQPPDANIVIAGFGTQFPDWWTRGIEAMAEHHGVIITAAIGNGSDAYDPVLYPGAGANAIGVGVVDSVNSGELSTNLAHFSLAHPQHSSFGPTYDRRCKPDIVTAGNYLAADVNEPDNYEPTGNWSSFSVPTVAGAIGLLVQKAREDPNLSAALSRAGGNCVMKAVLMNSAQKLPYWHKGRLERDDDHAVPLDYVQGAGALDAVGAYAQLTAGQSGPGPVSTTGWDLNRLQKERFFENVYKISLAESTDKVITATVVWNKHYDTAYPFAARPEKDANLRLELWAVDHNDPNNDYLLDYSDSEADNVEHIYCRADPNYTNYELVVSYSAIEDPNAMPASQRYGVAWNVDQPDIKDNLFWYDLNADGIVDESDFGILLTNLLKSIESPESYLFGDINGNGVIDINDLQILANHSGLKADWYKENNPQ